MDDIDIPCDETKDRSCRSGAAHSLPLPSAGGSACADQVAQPFGWLTRCFTHRRPMKTSLSPGLTFTRHHTVDEARCITFMGPDAMVYATPSMVSDVEYACYDAILPHLDPGESSVGTQVSIDHLRPAPLGARVRVDVRVERVDNRRVTFEFSVHDAVEEIGRGRHTRFVVDSAKTVDRIAAKRGALLKAGAIEALD